MKKTGCLIIILLLLSGCILPGEADRDTVLADEQLIYESSMPETENNSKTDDLEQNVSGPLQKGMRLSDEEKADLMREQQELYAFSKLEVTEQNLYVEILYALTNYVDEMQVSTLDTEEIDKVFQYVLIDHPEIFYTDGYSFIKYTLGNEVRVITFQGTYLYDSEERKIKEQLIEAEALEIIKGISADASDYEKVKYVYETIIEQTEYSIEARDNQNICSVFIEKQSVCQGYAKAVQYLLQKMGIQASLVFGTVETGEGHAWNLVKVDNAYYYVDTTWGDASYLFQIDGESTEKENHPAINYDYLCVTTEEIVRTHELSDLLPLPACDSLEANFYVREGAYFSGMDQEQLTLLFDKYQEEGKENVTLKCADDIVYEEMSRILLEEQQIFDYLQAENNRIFYTNSPKQRSLTFWLE